MEVQKLVRAIFERPLSAGILIAAFDKIFLRRCCSRKQPSLQYTTGSVHLHIYKSRGIETNSPPVRITSNLQSSVPHFISASKVQLTLLELTFVVLN